jgi:predicted MFS family arabinose efflux permease
MVAPALAGLMYALGRGSERGWASWDIVLTGVAGAALLVVLIRHQFSIKEPLLDLRLWNDRHFSGASVVSFLTMGAFMGMLYVFPLLYQDALGGSAADSGLVVFPEALGLMVAGQLADRMEKWVGVRVTALLAFGATVPIFTALAFTGPDTSPWLVRVLMFLVGVVLGVGVMVVQVTGFVSVDNARMGRAMSLYQVQRQLGSAVGVAVAASVVHTGVQADGGASQGAYRAALLVMSGALLLGFLAAVRWVREEKKETSVSP